MRVARVQTHKSSFGSRHHQHVAHQAGLADYFVVGQFILPKDPILGGVDALQQLAIHDNANGTAAEKRPGGDFARQLPGSFRFAAMPCVTRAVSAFPAHRPRRPRRASFCSLSSGSTSGTETMRAAIGLDSLFWNKPVAGQFQRVKRRLPSVHRSSSPLRATTWPRASSSAESDRQSGPLRPDSAVRGSLNQGNEFCLPAAVTKVPFMTSAVPLGSEGMFSGGYFSTLGFYPARPGANRDSEPPVCNPGSVFACLATPISCTVRGAANRNHLHRTWNQSLDRLD